MSVSQEFFKLSLQPHCITYHFLHIRIC